MSIAIFMHLELRLKLKGWLSVYALNILVNSSTRYNTTIRMVVGITYQLPNIPL